MGKTLHFWNTPGGIMKPHGERTKNSVTVATEAQKCSNTNLYLTPQKTSTYKYFLNRSWTFSHQSPPVAHLSVCLCAAQTVWQDFPDEITNQFKKAEANSPHAVYDVNNILTVPYPVMKRGGWGMTLVNSTYYKDDECSDWLQNSWALTDTCSS